MRCDPAQAVKGSVCVIHKHYQCPAVPGWRSLNDLASWPRNCKNSIQWEINDDMSNTKVRKLAWAWHFLPLLFDDHKWTFCSCIYGFPTARMKWCWWKSYWYAKAPPTPRASYQHGCYFPCFGNVNSIKAMCVSWVFLLYCSAKPVFKPLLKEVWLSKTPSPPLSSNVLCCKSFRLCPNKLWNLCVVPFAPAPSFPNPTQNNSITLSYFDRTDRWLRLKLLSCKIFKPHVEESWEDERWVV